MLRKIKSISSFGPFRNFKWDDSIKDANGKTIDLRPVNILYGRNYSGKTSLARIIRIFEQKKLPEHYEAPAFEVEWYDGTTNTQDNFAQCNCTVRVFSQDFVADNLSFLKDTRKDVGSIESFAILGGSNGAIETEIQEIQNQLGDDTYGKETGLHKQLLYVRQKVEAAEKTWKSLSSELRNDKQQVALGRNTGIKYQSDRFGDVNYSTAKLEADIKLISDCSYIRPTKEQIVDAENIVREQNHDIPSLSIPKEYNLSYFVERTREIVGRDIVSDSKIETLIHDAVLESWVKRGVDYHKEHGHGICAFCGQQMPSDRWQALFNHFDSASEKLADDICELIGEINDELNRVSNDLSIDASEYFLAFKQRIGDMTNRYNVELKKYRSTLNSLLSELHKRNDAISTAFKLNNIDDNTVVIKRIVSDFVTLYKEVGAYQTNFKKAKEDAYRLLRLDRVAEQVSLLNFSDKEANIARANAEYKKALEEENLLEKQIDDAITKISQKKQLLSDERHAATLINKYLSLLDGQMLKLQAVNDGEPDAIQYSFRVFRDGRAAYNLSEGECSIIAFCYFLAKLHEQSSLTAHPVVWIDDPISSLDGNHIFFVYSLIRGIIIAEKLCSQLIISTHNLEFFKFLRRMVWVDGSRQDTFCWLYILKQGNNSSVVCLPRYMKEYVIEFNYLFKHIFDCAVATETDETYDTVFYGFPNNARKFMELYLYFKFPDGEKDEGLKHNENMRRIFGEKVLSFMIDRVVNEGSHLKGLMERAIEPIEKPEIKEVAKNILAGLKTTDPMQYSALLKSIGKESEDPIS